MILREEGIEPPTAGSGIQRSTAELFPHWLNVFYRKENKQASCEMPTNWWLDWKIRKESAHRGARTHDHKVKSLALYRLS